MSEKPHCTGNQQENEVKAGVFILYIKVGNKW